MKYSKVRLTWGPNVGDTLTLNLNNPLPSDPYVITDISGLEPPPINIYLTQLVEGAQYQGQRADSREIIMTLKYQPNYALNQDVGVLRKKLYQMLTQKQDYNVIFRLMDDAGTGWVETDTRIKRMEPTIFTKDPQIIITFTCFDAFFHHGFYTHPNPSVFNAKTAIDPIVITTEGDAPTGFLMVFGMTANTGTWRIRNANNTKLLQINYPFLTGDRIWVDTRGGYRSLTLVRSGDPNKNIISYLTSNSTWPQLDGESTSFIPIVPTYVVDYLGFTARHWGF